MKRLWIGLILIAAGGVQAQDKATIIPNLPSASLQVNWSDFKPLLEQLQPAKAPTTPAPPPAPWSLNSAVFQADATAANAVRIEAEYQLHVWAEGWNKIPLLGSDTALESATLDDQASFLSVEGDRFVLLLNQPGPHVLKAVFHAPVEMKDGVVSFGFSCARSSVSRMTLRLGVSGVVVSAPNAADIISRPDGDGICADMIFRGGERVEASWRLPAKALPPKAPPRIACRQSTLATVSDRLIASHALLQFDVLSGDTTQFNLRLPATARVTQLEGSGTEWTSREEGESQTLTVILNHTVKDHFDLNLSYESPVPESAASLVLPRLEVLDMARQSGYLAVATRGPVETSVGTLPTGIRRIDTNELPASLRMQSANPILHAFAVSESAMPPTLDLRRLDEVTVQMAGIDQARYESVITEQGLMLTRAAYVVRNNLKKFLRVELGPDVEVWGATVAGREVRPARENAESAPGTILIPLAKSNETGRRVDAFQVELYYLRRLPALQSWTETLSLDTPKMDITANRVAWEILLPASRQVYGPVGDLTPVKCLSPMPMLSSIQAIQKQGTVSLVAPGAPAETLRRLREGMEKSPPPQTPPQPVPSVPPATISITEGVQPVRIELPRVGEPHYFERIVVPENTPLKLSLRIYDARLITTLQTILRFVAVLFGFLATGRVLRSFTRRVWINAAIVFVLLAVALHTAGMTPVAFTAWSLLGGILAMAARWRRGQPLTPTYS